LLSTHRDIDVRGTRSSCGIATGDALVLRPSPGSQARAGNLGAGYPAMPAKHSTVSPSGALPREQEQGWGLGVPCSMQRRAAGERRPIAEVERTRERDRRRDRIEHDRRAVGARAPSTSQVAPPFGRGPPSRRGFTTCGAQASHTAGQA
jgi:hypothetical protein